MNASCRPLNRTSKLKTLNIVFHKGVILEAPLIVRIFFHKLITSDRNKLQIEIVASKKFRTEYRQFMLKIQAELCHELLMKNHPIFQLFHNVTSVNGTLLNPCPISVCMNLNINFYHS